VVISCSSWPLCATATASTFSFSRSSIFITSTSADACSSLIRPLLIEVASSSTLATFLTYTSRYKSMKPRYERGVTYVRRRKRSKNRLHPSSTILCTLPMWLMSELRTTSAFSSWILNLPIKWRATAVRASSGHGRNQSTVQPLMRPGNFWVRCSNFGPTGEKQSTMCKLARTRLMKYAKRSSCEGSSPGLARGDFAYSTDTSP